MDQSVITFNMSKDYDGLTDSVLSSEYYLSIINSIDQTMTVINKISQSDKAKQYTCAIKLTLQK